MKPKGSVRLAGALVVFATIAGASSKARADSAAPYEKSRHHLFDPTPADRMRPFNADRPGATNSPQTVDAGHFKLESGLFNSTHEGGENGDPGKTDYSVNSLVLGLGLLDSLELQAGFASYVHPAVGSPGVGDTTIALKQNLVGNEAAAVAVAVMPSVKLATHSGDAGTPGVEGGVSLPLAFTLPAEWSLGVMPEWDLLRNAEDGGRHSEYFAGLVLGHAIVGDLSGLAQGSGRYTSDVGPGWSVDVGGALSYMISPNVQLDADVRFGVTTSAPDLSVSAGIVFRH